MLRGVSHVAGDYTFPAASGTQVMDGAVEVERLGSAILKTYLTPDYATDYPLQTAWSAVPTTLTELAQTTQMAALFAMDFPVHVLTCFTFANGTTNWWRAQPTLAKLQAEYTEYKALAVHFLTAFNGTGKKFFLQNWEGDWAFMDSTTPSTFVPREYVNYYAAFLAVRQRAVEDARRETQSDCSVFNVVEMNRVVDAWQHPERRRIVKDIAARLQPDVVSLSAYEPTIVAQGSWGASFTDWQDATTPMYTRALRAIKRAFPGVPLMIGEYGFPETEIPYAGGAAANVGNMIQVIDDISVAEGVQWHIYWEVFDNEGGRGYWTTLADGSLSPTGLKLQAMGPSSP